MSLVLGAGGLAGLASAGGLTLEKERILADPLMTPDGFEGVDASVGEQRLKRRVSDFENDGGLCFGQQLHFARAEDALRSQEHAGRADGLATNAGDFYSELSFHFWVLTAAVCCYNPATDFGMPSGFQIQSLVFSHIRKVPEFLSKAASK